MSITLSGTLTIDIGKGIVAAVELGRLHESVIEHCLTKGFDPILRDCHANATLESAGGDEAKQKEIAQAMVGKKLEALYDGTARIRGERRAVSSDPMASHRITVLRDMAGKEKWKEISKAVNRVELIRGLLVKYAEKIEPRALELKRLSEVNLLEAFDLSDLGL